MMKKFKKITFNLFLIIVCFTCIETAAAASITGAINEYDVIVNTSEGVELKNSNGESVIVPYNTELTITGEYENNEKLYGYTVYNGVTGYIDLNGAKLKTQKISSQNAVELEKNKEVIVLEGDVYLYNGPSKKYAIVSEKIPVGTVLKYKYIDSLNEIWAYVEYNGVKGWINIYSNGIYEQSYVATSPKWGSALLVLDKNINMYDSYTLNSNIIVSEITIGTELNCKYEYVSSDYTALCYVEYNNKKGWVSISNNRSLAQEYDRTIMVLEEDGLTVYSDVNQSSSYTLDVPKYSELDIKYSYASNPYTVDYYYVEYNGKKGWLYDGYNNEKYLYELNTNYLYTWESLNIYSDFDLQNISLNINNPFEFIVKYEYENKAYIEYTANNNLYNGWISKTDNNIVGLYLAYYTDIELDKDVNVYEKNNSASDILFSIKSRTLVKSYPIGEWYYIEYNDQKGFVNLSLPYVEVNDELDSEKNSNEQKSNSSLGTKEIIILFVGVAVIIGGIVIFINKKKNLKNQNTMMSGSDLNNNDSNNHNIM